MLGRTKQIDLPRRVVVYYLLFCLFPLAWMTISTVVVSNAVLNAENEASNLAYLGQAHSVVLRDLVKGQTGTLQTLVERFQRENGLQYAAVVGSDGKFLAHTYRGRVDKTYERPDGEMLNWGEFSATRYGSGGDRTREYSAPLTVSDKPIGSLLIAVAEPSLWTTLPVVAVYAPLTLFGPLALTVAGAVTLNCLVRPMSGIDAQLRHVAVSPTVSDVELRPVASNCCCAWLESTRRRLRERQ